MRRFNFVLSPEFSRRCQAQPASADPRTMPLTFFLAIVLASATAWLAWFFG
ncbi:MAG TPA: hypothetical protein VMF67_07635 [Rhizomicrobium sp.]|nr:hypothetical protein [Rhizomicrobium sp.]